MGGINGYFVADPQIPGNWFAEAIREARHRGPDGTAYWVPGSSGWRSIGELSDQASEPASVALGISRLANVDPSPETHAATVVPGRAAISLDGSIYNYVEIRDELAALGWTFDSSGDAEVLAKAYLEWGPQALARLDGAWALAVYDFSKRGILLARDRFGERPLHLTPWRGGLAFGSEIKQLLRYPGIAARLDARRAAAFVVTGRPHDGVSSWFESIRQSHPGEWLWIDASGTKSGVYYDIEQGVASVAREPTPSAWCTRFGELVSASVRRRLRAGATVGALLSSGIDSSLIFAEAAAQCAVPPPTFTVISSDPRLDEGAPRGGLRRRSVRDRSRSP
jgi:asparagine synthase (glutamine-hydrolysing)